MPTHPKTHKRSVACPVNAANQTAPILRSKYGTTLPRCGNGRGLRTSGAPGQSIADKFLIAPGKARELEVRNICTCGENLCRDFGPKRIQPSNCSQTHLAVVASTHYTGVTDPCS